MPPYSAFFPPKKNCFLNMSIIINGIKLFHMGAESVPWCQHLFSALELGEQCPPWQWHQSFFRQCRNLGLRVYSQVKPGIVRNIYMTKTLSLNTLSCFLTDAFTYDSPWIIHNVDYTEKKIFFLVWDGQLPGEWYCEEEESGQSHHPCHNYWQRCREGAGSPDSS